jgi:DinB superfamily
MNGPEVLVVAQRVLQLNGKLYIRAIRDITDTQGTQVVHPAINPAHWIAGHLLSNRFYLYRLCGHAAADPFAQLYTEGKGLIDNALYPPISEILVHWRGIAPLVEAAILKWGTDDLNAPAPFPLPVAEQTLRGFLAFWLQHESYHIGQLSVVHQLLGHGPIGYT